MFSTKEITTYEELKTELLASNHAYDLDDIGRAYDLAARIHEGQKRKSGDPLTTHLLTVAAYAVRLNLDSISVMSALLHEVLERTELTLDDIEKEFGVTVAFIIDGITNIKHQTSTFSVHNEDPQAFRKLILRATDDIRVLIIRLANKVHNVLSIEFLDPERRINQAYKLRLVYAPLCEYLGLGYFLEVFHDAAFKILEPEEHTLIEDYINHLKLSSTEVLQSFTEKVTEEMRTLGIEQSEISFRTKNTWSAYNKAIKKHLLPGEKLSVSHLTQLQDLLGVRLIVNDITECYLLLGHLHNKYEYVAEEFDDYIVKPKKSGYRSIHTVIYYDKLTIEVQIRTFEMHEFNEFGPASHIAYKMFGANKMHKESLTWTKELVDWKNKELQDEGKYKIRAFAQSIFVFTPKGKVVQLDKGSTPIDFAFQVHTELGAHYTGAKVNGVMRPMTYELSTGDIIEVLKSKNVNVNRDWLGNCKMSITKSRIRKVLRNQNDLRNL